MKRNGELQFFCRVSLESNPEVYVSSSTAKVKVKTGILAISTSDAVSILSSLSVDHSAA